MFNKSMSYSYRLKSIRFEFGLINNGCSGGGV